MKDAAVRAVFESIAPGYDFQNSLFRLFPAFLAQLNIRQPVKRFSLFHVLSPCLSKTSFVIFYPSL